jgi:hypothetical protein
MKQFYITLLTLTFSVSALAQANFKPGYILTTDSSRINGLIDYRGTNSNAALQVAFKTSNDTQPIVYNPSQIIGYGLADGKQYESITIVNSDKISHTYFMEVLAKGAATLYFMKHDGVKERFFVTTNDGRIHELIQESRRVDKGNGKIYNVTLKQYVGMLTSVLNACAEVQPLIEKARLEQSDMIKVVNKYNACIAPAQVQVARTEDDVKTKVEKLIIVGGTYTNATFSSSQSVDDYATKGDITPSLDVTGGIAFNITAAKLSNKLSLYTGVMYQQYRVEGKYKKDYAGGSYYTYDYYLEAKHIKVPAMIRYTWPKGKFRAYINAGAQAGFLLSADSNVKRYGKFGAQENNYEFDMMPDYREIELGFIGGLGIKTEAFGKRSLSLELRQEKNHGLSAGIGFIQKNNISSVLLGMAF